MRNPPWITQKFSKLYFWKWLIQLGYNLKSDLQQAGYNLGKVRLDLQQAGYNFSKVQLDLQRAGYNSGKVQLDPQQAGSGWIWENFN